MNRETGQEVGLPAAGVVQLGPIRLYVITTAITTGVTAAPTGSSAGDLILTSNATGNDKMFKNVAGTCVAV